MQNTNSNLYKLIKDYPGHKIGDRAFYDPNISGTSFLWAKPLHVDGNNNPIEYAIIPRDFQPDRTPEWFEKVIYLDIIAKDTNRRLNDGDYAYFITKNTNPYDNKYHVSNKIKMTNLQTNQLEWFESYHAACEYCEEKNNIPKAIFRTHDNVDIFKGDNYYVVYQNLTIHNPVCVGSPSEGFISTNKYFKDIENAYAYIAENTCLFITENNVKIYRNNEYFSVDSYFIINRFRTSSYATKKDFINFPKSIKTFSTLQAAREYVIMNKPVISLNDLLQPSNTPFDMNFSTNNLKKLRQFVNSKMNFLPEEHNS